MKCFELHKQRTFLPINPCINDEVWHQALSLVDGFPGQSPTACLRYAGREQTVDFGVHSHMMISAILVNLPLQCIMLGPPSIPGQRFTCQSAPMCVHDGACCTNGFAHYCCTCRARETEVKCRRLRKLIVGESGILARPRRHPASAEAVNVQPRSFAHVTIRKGTDFDI